MSIENKITRPLSIPHLVFGLVFSGLAAVWFIGEATNADLPRTAVGFPLVLIAAGVVGLVATLTNNRRRSRAAYEASIAQQDTSEDTTVLEEENR